MINNKTFLAIIPARGGSKRLPRKNVLDLAGKPLLSWTIEAALNSKYLDKVIVSSDDDEVLALASQEQKNIELIKRPIELALDTSTTVSVIEHAINLQTIEYEYCILLQPTSPLRTSKHIDEAIELLIDKNADAVISVCECEHSPLWSNTLPDDGSMNEFICDDLINKRSQDLPVYYRLNGAVYIAKIKEFLEQQTFILKNRVFAYKMEQAVSVDIDTACDFRVAEFCKLNDF